MKLRKNLAILLIFILILSILPLNALAEDLGSENITNEASDAIITNEIIDDMAEENNADNNDEFTELINDARIQVQASTVNPLDWETTLSSDEKTITLDRYKGTSKDVVIPASGDFGDKVEAVQISNTLMKSIVKDTQATSIVVSDHGAPVIATGTDWSYVFSYSTSSSLSYNESLVSANLENLYTGNITDMNHMFYHCHKLTELKISQWDTSAVTDLSYMFYECWILPSLDVSQWDTGAVTNMSHMFACWNVTDLDVSQWNTSSVTDMSYMFYDFLAQTSLDVSGFDTSSVTNMEGMFSNCKSLTNLDVSGFDTSGITNMKYMFNVCTHMTSLDVSGWDTNLVTDMSYMFYFCVQLTCLDLSGFDTSLVTNMTYMFYNCQKLQTIIVSEKWSTANVTSSDSMFYNCGALTGSKGTRYISLYGTDASYARIDEGTSKPGYLTKKDYYLTFTAVSEQSSLSFNWKSGENVMFSTDNHKTWEAYTPGTAITLEKAGDSISFKGENVITDSEHHFSMSGSIAASGSVSSLTDTGGGDKAVTIQDACYSNMFDGCTSLITAPELPAQILASGCYQKMFAGCSNLKKAPNLKSMSLAPSCYSGMFSGCTSLTTTPKLPAMILKKDCYKSMFSGCTSLTKALYLPAKTLVPGCYQEMFINCSNLNEVDVGFIRWDERTTAVDMATANWLSGVAETGNFYCLKELDRSKIGVSYIPAGWVLKKKNRIIGDLNQNGLLELVDARIAKRIVMKDPTVEGEYTTMGFISGDLDGNGKITINEVRKIERVALGTASFE